MAQRFLTFPAELFERTFKELLPEFSRKWHSRKQRPLPSSIEFTRAKFERIWACDGSTLEAIFKKLESLDDVPIGKLAGKMGVVIDLITRLPIEIWFRENAKASDINFEPDILNLVQAGTLLLLDRGFYHFRFWQQLIDKEVHIITRLKKRMRSGRVPRPWKRTKQGAAFQIERVFTDSYSIRDRLIRMGSGTEKAPYVTLRLIEIRSNKTWYSYATFSGEASPEKLAYLTSVVDPLILPPVLSRFLRRGTRRARAAM